ncbi:phosphoenolpyruvate--protein phosphotransferase [Paramagnetospirillum marisnigri]|uniref:Phosphoenolpyruvate-protein phosphotransferase n=1 Tax=Paramagnetospirillum marisnigri TaxID=1285242 RepID=A0A178MNK2_9PROT|nr:phosphoenolpyruvate--protein phosphotransferase [Paramagnetospirillum marisnigri]OAN50259.1 phosphoenolpyruvate--protein phosphotransferase [Paramagnetospirillum marisnigri]
MTSHDGDDGASSQASRICSGQSRGEVVLDGLGVSRGIAIGSLYLHDSGTIAVRERRIIARAVEAECARFRDSAEEASLQVEQLQAKAGALGGAAGEELGYLLDAYRQMLHGSRLIRGVEARIRAARVNAEAAVQQEINDIIRGFEAMEDPYLAARLADIRDIGRRLLRNLTKADYRPFTALPRNAVIVADEMTPADTALLDPKTVAGLATVVGGAESHTAIMARSLGLPSVLGIADLLRQAKGGETVIIDGTNGLVVINPLPETLAYYRREKAAFLKTRRLLGRLRDVPAVTTDGLRISLQANMELPAEVGAVLESGAEGIGLLRSEFLYMNRDDVPSEDEQYRVLRDVVERMDGRTVTVRTFDAGGDKLAPALGCAIGPNPALGLRAIRLGLARQDLLEAQLAAILRAAAHGPVRILIPMVATVGELRATREVMNRVVRRLRAAQVPLPDPLPPLGAMIEIPGAALAADAISWHADFFSIGTNDLTQYTLAIDRSDEAVAHLFNPLHPAVLRLIQFTAQAAARARIPVCVCGEMAGDPRFSALLMGLGIRELSMTASNVPVIKARIRTTGMAAAAELAREVMELNDGGRIAQLVDRFNSAGR